MFHPPSQALCDFGEALVVIGRVEQKAPCFVLDLTHSDGCFVEAYPAEASQDGQVSGFAFPDIILQGVLYDNTKLPVAGMLEDGKRSAPVPSRRCSPTTCSRTGSSVPGLFFPAAFVAVVVPLLRNSVTFGRRFRCEWLTS